MDTKISTSGLNYIVLSGELRQEVTKFLNSAIDDARTLELVNGE